MFQSVISLIPMLLRVFLAISLVVLFDLYAYQAIRTLTADLSSGLRRGIRITYWVINISFYVFGILGMAGYHGMIEKNIRTVISGMFFALFLAKVLMMIPMLMEDIYRIFNGIISWISGKKDNQVDDSNTGFLVSRKKFISQVSIGLGGLSFASLTYGVVRGAHNYKIHRVDVPISGLPPGFKGLRIGHLSDIHSGSFWDKDAVEKGVEKLIKEKPDIIFFTGDLVNNISEEMNEDYMELFGRLKAPMGIYSILGNHDYGDYHNWPDKVEFKGNSSQKDKSHMSPMQKANLENLINKHKQMGWDILLNENRIISRGGDSMALIGVENYGARGRFAKYGNLDEALEGVSDHPFKILLSHDPSHFESQVLNKTNIALTLSGHTHGAQFGIETAGFKWSPVKYMYKQWAGLYTFNEQQLYVNRGFGYLGYPGRLGIRPEIGILTLV
ncbi:MAG: metallophosphoesterase [Bacteroidia bacterium]|nr:metallophosphoesterase [Bacteroidia bacterium]